MGFLAKKVWITNAAKTILGTTAQTVEDALITLKNNVGTVASDLLGEATARQQGDTTLSADVANVRGIVNKNLNKYSGVTPAQIGTYITGQYSPYIYRYFSNVDVTANISVDSGHYILSKSISLPSELNTYSYAFIEFAALQITYTDYNRTYCIPISTPNTASYDTEHGVTFKVAIAKSASGVRTLEVEGYWNEVASQLGSLGNSYVFYSILMY